MLAAACSLNRSLFVTNVYNLTFLYHICIGKINELVLFCSVLVTTPCNGIINHVCMNCIGIQYEYNIQTFILFSVPTQYCYHRHLLLLSYIYFL